MALLSEPGGGLAREGRLTIGMSSHGHGVGAQIPVGAVAVVEGEGGGAGEFGGFFGFVVGVRVGLLWRGSAAVVEVHPYKPGRSSFRPRNVLSGK